MNPLERRNRPEIRVMLGVGFITDEDIANLKLGESDSIKIDAKFKPDRTPAEQFNDQARQYGYDFTPLTQEEIDSLPNLARKFFTLFSELPESRYAYQEALDQPGEEKGFSFMKNGHPLEVVFGVNINHIPFLHVTDLTYDDPNIPLLAINDPYGEFVGIHCEGSMNDQEALLSANGLLLEKFGGPVDLS